MIFGEFAAAFPSLFHSWIHAVFAQLGFPDGFLEFLQALLFHNFALGQNIGRDMFLYLILVGIIQGCPSSGLFFAVATYPFFKELQRIQEGLTLAWPHNAAIRRCADDIGAALASFRFLKLLEPTFRLAQEASGLVLNAAKCIIVPLGGPVSEVAPALQQWLNCHLPSWSKFNIRDKAKYLGVFMGPGHVEESWDQALAKFWKEFALLLLVGCRPSLPF